MCPGDTAFGRSGQDLNLMNELSEERGLFILNMIIEHIILKHQNSNMDQTQEHIHDDKLKQSDLQLVFIMEVAKISGIFSKIFGQIQKNFISCLSILKYLKSQ